MSKLSKFNNTILIDKPIGLYLHVPFCTVLCPFCDFYKMSWTPSSEKDFIQALQKEIKYYKRTKKIKLKSIFLGGGTPSVLSSISIQTIMNSLEETFDLSACNEKSFEANPEDINSDTLNHFKKAGFNRISLGVQTLDKKECSYLGRGHSPKQSHQALNIIKKNKNWNLSVDIMFGLKKTGLTSLKITLDQILKYKPNHVSTYCLTIEDNTVFHKKGIKQLDPEKELEQYKLIQKTLKKANFNQYEVSSFAQPDYECEHNKNYWNFGNFIGLGPSGHSFINPFRFTNDNSLKNYLNKPIPPIFQKSIPPLNKNDLLKEHILANFRQLSGLNITFINKTYNINFEKKYKQQLDTLYTLNYIKKTKDHIKATSKGLYMLNTLVSQFL